MAGKGYWFDNRDEALRFLREQVATGRQNFDVGCFQVNYRWHRHGFASLDTMIDPMVNARYAARFLTELYGEKGNWSDAVGAYHSRTPEHARRYLKTYKVHFAAVTAGGGGGRANARARAQARTRARQYLSAFRFGHVGHPGTGWIARRGKHRGRGGGHSCRCRARPGGGPPNDPQHLPTHRSPSPWH